MSRLFTSIVILLLLYVGAGFFCGCARVQSAQSINLPIKSAFDRIMEIQPVRISIQLDLDSLQHFKEKEQYLPATIFFWDTLGRPNDVSIEVSTRGETRKRYCDIPPLKIRFSESLLYSHGLAAYKTLKLVLPCKAGPEYLDLLHREFLCYQLCEVLTGYAFRAYQIQVSILDNAGADTLINTVAFLIEHEKELAHRLDAQIQKNNDIPLKTVDKESYNRLALFQYLIGNTDWNLSTQHNIKIVKPMGKGSPIPVPYDFDYSGLVNAYYAKPHPALPTQSVRDRLWQWRGKEVKAIRPSLESFLERRTEVLDLVAMTPIISEKSRKDIMDYLRSGFEILQDEQMLQELIDK